VPGRKRRNMYEKKPLPQTEQTSEKCQQEKVELRREKLAEKKNWTEKLVTVDTGIFEFLDRHAKEMKSFIEATYT
jgi:hypothetical protein